MKQLFSLRQNALAAGVALAAPVLLSASLALADNSPQTAAAYKAPRTADGQPDFQGNWTNATLTPVERDTRFGNRRALTDAEAAQIEGSAAEHVARNALPTDPKLGIQDLPKDCGYGFTGTN